MSTIYNTTVDACGSTKKNELVKADMIIVGFRGCHMKKVERITKLYLLNL